MDKQYSLDEWNELSTEQQNATPFKQRPSGIKNATIVITAVFFLLVGSCGAWLCGGNNEADGPRIYKPIDALLESHQFVEQKLKAPSTAEFASLYESTVTPITDTSFIVVSYVDAQNSLGVMLRYNYMCGITFLPNNRVQVSALTIE